MGSMHAEGWGGIKQNNVEATKWFMLAARQVTHHAVERNLRHLHLPLIPLVTNDLRPRAEIGATPTDPT